MEMQVSTTWIKLVSVFDLQPPSHKSIERFLIYIPLHRILIIEIICTTRYRP